MAEESGNETSKQKTLLELEVKDLKQRHKSDLGKKDVIITSVCTVLIQVLLI